MTATQPTQAIVEKNVYLPGYLDERTLQTLARRCQQMLPYADKLKPQNFRSLAQAALQLRLNPFIGEICYIPDTDWQKGAVYVQYAGRLRKAREQLEREGGAAGASMWYRMDEITDEADRIRWAIPVGAIAFRCTLNDSITVEAYAAAYARMAEAMAKVYKDEDKLHATIVKTIGTEPQTVSIGYVTQEEQADMLKTQSGKARKNQYPVIEKAQKRAHVAALKRRFHFEFTTPDVDDIPLNVAQALDAVMTGAGQWMVKPAEQIIAGDVVNAEQPPLSADDEYEAQRAAEKRVDEMLAGQDICQRDGCEHTIEEHGLTGACEHHGGCQCPKYMTRDELTSDEWQRRLEKGKRALGRDSGSLV